MEVTRNERGYRIGQSHPQARYTDREIELVHQLRDDGLSYGRIAQAMEMPKSTVAEIIEGKIRCQQIGVEVRRK